MTGRVWQEDVMTGETDRKDTTSYSCYNWLIAWSLYPDYVYEMFKKTHKEYQSEHRCILSPFNNPDTFALRNNGGAAMFPGKSVRVYNGCGRVVFRLRSRTESSEKICTASIFAGWRGQNFAIFLKWKQGTGAWTGFFVCLFFFTTLQLLYSRSYMSLSFIVAYR